ncbi:MAG TPA: DUF3787 domain-containing protein [Clostridia bacterium]|nr:DUF3787 domain-containing protein [Clostridia bacterium]
MKKPTNNSRDKSKVTGAFVTQPISQPDKRQNKTDVAMPDDDNVVHNKNWVDENQK